MLLHFFGIKSKIVVIEPFSVRVILNFLFITSVNNILYHSDIVSQYYPLSNIVRQFLLFVYF